MKTEIENQTETQNVNLETVNPETSKPKTAKTRKPKTATLPAEITSAKTIGESIPKSLFNLFPETEKLFTRLSSYGLNRFKFDFGYSTKTTGKRNIVIEYRFFNLPIPVIKNRKPIPDKLYTSANHQISGKLYFSLFPEIKTLFDRLAKTYSANNFRLNISFASVTSPQKIREHIIKTDAPETYLP
jgi:hypothetical protein